MCASFTLTGSGAQRRGTAGVTAAETSCGTALSRDSVARIRTAQRERRKQRERQGQLTARCATRAAARTANLTRSPLLLARLVAADGLPVGCELFFRQLSEGRNRQPTMSNLPVGNGMRRRFGKLLCSAMDAAPGGLDMPGAGGRDADRSARREAAVEGGCASDACSRIGSANGSGWLRKRLSGPRKPVSRRDGASFAPESARRARPPSCSRRWRRSLGGAVKAGRAANVG